MRRQLKPQHRLPIALLAIAAGMCCVLTVMGRVWWCEDGDLVPWSFDVRSKHNSQHLLDPYALSHIEHGIGLFVLLSFAALKWQWLSETVRVLIVAMFEATWEILENTPMMIHRYREATVSLDYFGDSILNSVSDLCMCLAGTVLVRKTSWKIGVAVFFALEIISVLWIRDSLLLNMLMLISPVESIKQWQAG